MKRFLSILFWSIITAAFIGPGTVTTAAKSGTAYGYDLLWALLFSTVACLVLQEASARVTVVSGLSLGEAIRQQFHSGLKGFSVLVMVLGAIVFGCAAYQTGNILGGVTGAVLGTAKTFGSFSGVAMTVEGVSIQEKKQEPPKEAPKPAGTLPKGF